LSSAIYRVYFKILLQRGLSKAEIVFLRLCGVTLVLGGILLVQNDLFRADLLLQTSILGLLGFTLPLFLILNIIQRLEISSFAMLLFLYPTTTFMMSAALGYTQFHGSDVLATVVIAFGVIRYETTIIKRS
jgi:threonine/homoserine efflux transporter RhtA